MTLSDTVSGILAILFIIFLLVIRTVGDDHGDFHD